MIDVREISNLMAKMALLFALTLIEVQALDTKNHSAEDLISSGRRPVEPNRSLASEEMI